MMGVMSVVLLSGLMNQRRITRAGAHIGMFF